MDDPATALQTAENALRLAVRAVLGDDWQGLVPDTEKLEAKRLEEQKRRDGARLSEDLLSFTEFHELTDIIISQWERFKPVFDDQARTKVWFGVLADVRNAIAHSRQLVEHERSLIAGVSGQIRNQVTIFRTSMNPVSAHYAVIERVQDSFGMAGEHSVGYVVDIGQREKLRLEVGDRLSFECTGSDSRGRELEWILLTEQHTTPIRTGTGSIKANGTSASLALQITDAHVGEWLYVHIFVRPVDARFTRYGRLGDIDSEQLASEIGHDDKREFVYAVNPPV